MTARIWPPHQDDPPAESWQDRALCAQVDPELFFPEKHETALAKLAKRVCRACPVRQECLDDALDRGEEFGVWGGLSSQERRRLKRVGLAA